MRKSKYLVVVVFGFFLLGMGQQLYAEESVMSAVDENMRRLEHYMQQTQVSVVERPAHHKTQNVETGQKSSSFKAKNDLLQAIQQVSLTDSEKLEVISLILAK